MSAHHHHICKRILNRYENELGDFGHLCIIAFLNEGLNNFNVIFYPLISSNDPLEIPEM